jgi:PhnB protein
MKNTVQPIPERYGNVTPYLILDNAAHALEFYKNNFGAVEELRMDMPGGKIGHAEIRIGASIIMLADECPEMDARSPKTVGGSPVILHLYVEDVDAVVAQAIKSGAKLLQPVEDKFYGDRSGAIADPFGHIWNIATHKEDLSPEETKKRGAEAMAQMAGAK